MNAARSLWAAIENNPSVMRALHGWLTIAWLLAAVPCVLINGLRNSVPLLVFISVYANVAGHFAAWQAARVEQKQDEQS